MIITQKSTVFEKRPREQAAIPSYRWGRIAVLSFPLILLNTAWIANSEMKTGVTELTISTLFIGVIFILVAITAINLAVRRFWGSRVAFSHPELMLLYSILSVSSVVAGVGNMGFFIPFLASPHWYTANGNGYRSFWHLLPPEMIPSDPMALQKLALGHSTFFEAPIIRVWLPVLLTWSPFFLILLWINFCTASILRKRWAEEEHLPFPVIALPLEITRDGCPLFRNRLFWLGVAIPAVLHTINTMASIVPGFISWPINSIHDATAGFFYPWNGLSPIWTAVHPAGVGFGFLVNTDVLFSFTFFYFVRKCLNLVGVFTGWRTPVGGYYGDGSFQFPFTSYVGWGAWAGFALIMLWQNRDYVWRYVARAIRGASDEDKGDPLSPRAAVLGVVLGFLFLCGFIWRLGGSWWIAPLVIGIYLLLMITLARLQAEMAVLSPAVGWIYPQDMVTSLVGTSNLSAIDSVHIGLLSWFNTDYRAAALPHDLQAMVGQKRAGGSLRPLPIVLILAAAVALVSALICDLQLYYVNGMDTGLINTWRVSVGNDVWRGVDNYIHQPHAPKPACAVGVGVGFLITALLSTLRNSYPGFLLSPSAFVLSTSFANDFFWLDILIALVVKAALLRYGGIRAYRIALPFFLGLILGDFGTGAAWSIVGAVMNLNLFRTFAT